MSVTRIKDEFLGTCRVLQTNKALNEITFRLMLESDDGTEDCTGWSFLFPYDIVYKYGYRDFVKNSPEDYLIMGNTMEFRDTELANLTYEYHKK